MATLFNEISLFVCLFICCCLFIPLIPPFQIGLCSSLSILSIRNNQLVKIPSEVSSLSQLSILVLTGNQLHSLPYALTQLTNITAIWIAENQSRPILDLQLSKNERGEKCLTCFLFPQQGAEPPYNEGVWMKWVKGSQCYKLKLETEHAITV